MLELSCEMGTSRMVAATALKILERHGAAQADDLQHWTRTARGSAYMEDMDPQDTTSALGGTHEDVEAIVARAQATQPTSIWDLAARQVAARAGQGDDLLP